MVDNKAQGACFDAADNQGGAIASIFLLDYSDEILEYTSNSQIEEALDECIGIMPAADQKRRLRRKQTP